MSTITLVYHFVMFQAVSPKPFYTELFDTALFNIALGHAMLGDTTPLCHIFAKNQPLPAKA